MNICESNDTTYAVVVAGVILRKDNKYLLVQEKQEKCYGKWNLPAGKVDSGDSIEKTAVKEAKEESGYDVKLLRKIDIYQDKSTDAVKHVFEADIIGGELDYPEDEILDAKWIEFDQLKNMKNNGELRENFIIDAIIESRKESS